MDIHRKIITDKNQKMEVTKNVIGDLQYINVLDLDILLRYYLKFAIT